MEIIRSDELQEIEKRFGYSPVVAILGPRQCGKTTLARQYSRKYASGDVHFFDLEDPADLGKLDQPKTHLEPLRGLVVIDEIQRRPDLFPFLRVLADKKKCRYLILGSASRDLLRQSSETLAGRISYMELSGFHIDELDKKNVESLWVRGGFPASFLAKNNDLSFRWRQDFVRTFLERDIPNLGIRVPAATLHRFWTMLAHYHGQTANLSEIGRSLSVSDTAIRHYLDILTGTFMIRQLRPWHHNTKKRLVRSPKIYFRDSGIFHSLMSLQSKQSIQSHPKLGASWEGFALEQAVKHLGLEEENVYFWATHTGAEIDLVFPLKGKMYGIEIKYSDAPKITASLRSAISELSLHHAWVLYPGDESYSLDKKTSLVSIRHMEKINP